jgi:hypothetical protein
VDGKLLKSMSKYRFLMGIEEGLSFSDYFDEEVPYEVKPTHFLQPMQELAPLLEVHQQDLYHYTVEGGLLGMLKTNSIKLTFAGGTQADQQINKGYSFFLSCGREKYGNYARGKATYKDVYYEVVVHLDGRKLTADGYKVFNVEYWGSSAHEHSEKEERIASNEDELKPLERYVIDIHVFIGKIMDNPHSHDRFQQINQLAQTCKVPVYFYQDSLSFKRQDTKKALRNVGDIIPQPQWDDDSLSLKKHISTRAARTDKASHIQALLKVYRGEPLSDEYPEDRIMRQLLYYPHDAYAVIMADAHNYKKDHLPIFREVVKAMKEVGVSNFKDFITYVMKREQEKEKASRNK